MVPLFHVQEHVQDPVELGLLVVSSPGGGVALAPLLGEACGGLLLTAVVSCGGHAHQVLTLCGNDEILDDLVLYGQGAELIGQLQRLVGSCHQFLGIGAGLHPGGAAEILDAENCPVQNLTAVAKLADVFHGLAGLIAVYQVGNTVVELLGGDVFVLIPGEGGCQDDAVQGGVDGGGVAVVTPGGVQGAHGAVFVAGADHLDDVLLGVVGNLAHLVPAGGAGAEDLGIACLTELHGVFQVGVGVVAPVQHDNVLGEAVHDLGMVENDIPPHHNGLAPGGNVVDDLAGELQIQSAAVLPCVSALAKVEGLVAADVEVLTAEQGDVLVDHAADDIDALGVGGIDGMVDHSVVPLVAGGLVGLQLAVLLPLGAFQQTVQVAEGGKRGNEVDEVVVAILIQLHDLRRGHGVLGAGDAYVFVKQEGVLDIQLEGVLFIVSQHIDDPLGGFHGGHSATGDILVEAAGLHVGSVLDVQHGDDALGLLDELAQGLNTVEQACKRVTADGDGLGANGKGIALAVAIPCDQVHGAVQSGLAQNLGHGDLGAGLGGKLCRQLLRRLEDTVVAGIA